MVVIIRKTKIYSNIIAIPILLAGLLSGIIISTSFLKTQVFSVTESIYYKYRLIFREAKYFEGLFITTLNEIGLVKILLIIFNITTLVSFILLRKSSTEIMIEQLIKYSELLKGIFVIVGLYCAVMIILLESYNHLLCGIFSRYIIVSFSISIMYSLLFKIAVNIKNKRKIQNTGGVET